uniref:GIY-YIG endonuclease n=1 Tax=Tolypocladium cylindrosporum TaxID=38005 RepID=A0A6G7P009_9HYPO|nr:GIY-YIG endonuclease [Tolypocladium cylindrosporum]QIJ60543.1 GIY-YIG endonuclease [Tolypocladium cylindrosporum]
MSTNVNIKSRLPNRIEKSYYNPMNQREEIRVDNNGKIGVYCWENKINNKIYVGSGDPLYLRLSDYYQDWYLGSRTNLYIVRSLNKYSMSNFNLHILEYTDSENLIKCEQKWIDFVKPEYNTNLTAGSTKGYKHSIESIEKMRILATGRKHTDKVKDLMSKNRQGINNAFYNKKHTDDTIEKFKIIASNRTYVPVKGLEVEITDIETKITSTHSSIREAAKYLNSDIKTLLRREAAQKDKCINKPYRNRYIININRSND